MNSRKFIGKTIEFTILNNAKWRTNKWRHFKKNVQLLNEPYKLKLTALNGILSTEKEREQEKKSGCNHAFIHCQRKHNG